MKRKAEMTWLRNQMDGTPLTNAAIRWLAFNGGRPTRTAEKKLAMLRGEVKYPDPLLAPGSKGKYGCVYYAEHETGFIKIGYATHFKQRWNSLKSIGCVNVRVEYVLLRGRGKTRGAHWGSLIKLERLRQCQFQKYLVPRSRIKEWFRNGPDLREFVKLLPEKAKRAP